MNVVRNATRSEQFTFAVPNDAANVSVQVWTPHRIDPRLAVLGAENDVVKKACVRLGHVEILRCFAGE
jgi:hypothetical protein